ncbi:hypothetical protein [Paenibacillus naphthalenovorans]|uniref:hypothetical protein n=1 Tax=Paenibacillus naphthalenovorans TaxID=162209 RepID=UPI003D2E569E
MENGREALRIARNLIRVGRVSSRSLTNGTVQVVFHDRDDMVSKDLPVLEAATIPNIGDQVACIFLGNGIEDGFCLGRFYSEENPPPPVV